MSRIPIDRSPDLQRLRLDGYNIRVNGVGFLIVDDVPYVNSSKQIVTGALVSSLDLAGDVTKQPQDHTIKFIGEYPCDTNGAQLNMLRHQSGNFDVGDKLFAQHSFSRKPPRGYYLDYHEKVTTYVALLGKSVAAIDPDATARTGRVVEPEDDDSPFNYLDTASSRAEINGATAKLGLDSVAIIGLGGTGSYVLDLIAKAPVRHIHLYDTDRFLTHNAFRAPGAPSIEELREQPSKVEYLARIYSHMHRGVVPHPVDIDAQSVEELHAMSFVFLCMDGGPAKKDIVDKLESFNVPFIDVGMGLYARNDTIGGTLRVVTSLPDGREVARKRIPFASDDINNEYDKNIQIADLNALNACLAVIKWKKFCNFYFDLGKERSTYLSVGTNLLVNDDLL